MAIDFTSLLDKLQPDPGGESTLRMRTGTVSAVNANGTLDITMSSGVVVPGVPKLATAYAPVGANVQMISQRGGLLVIGAVGSGAAGGAMIKTGKTTGGPSGAAFWTVNNIPFNATFPGVPNVHINANGVPTGAPQWVARAQGITTTQFNLTAYGPSGSFSLEWQWTAIYMP